MKDLKMKNLQIKNLIFLIAFTVLPAFAEPGGRGAGNGKDGKMSMFFQYYADQMAATGISSPRLRKENVEDSIFVEKKQVSIDFEAIQEFVEEGNVVTFEGSSLFLDHDQETRHLDGKLFINSDLWIGILSRPDSDKKIIYELLYANGYRKEAAELSEFYSHLIRQRTSEVTSLNPSDVGVPLSPINLLDYSNVPQQRRNLQEPSDRDSATN